MKVRHLQKNNLARDLQNQLKNERVRQAELIKLSRQKDEELASLRAQLAAFESEQVSKATSDDSIATDSQQGDQGEVSSECGEVVIHTDVLTDEDRIDELRENIIEILRRISFGNKELPTYLLNMSSLIEQLLTGLCHEQGSSIQNDVLVEVLSSARFIDFVVRLHSSDILFLKLYCYVNRHKVVNFVKHSSHVFLSFIASFDEHSEFVGSLSKRVLKGIPSNANALAKLINAVLLKMLRLPNEDFFQDASMYVAFKEQYIWYFQKFESSNTLSEAVLEGLNFSRMIALISRFSDPSIHAPDVFSALYLVVASHYAKTLVRNLTPKQLAKLVIYSNKLNERKKIVHERSVKIRYSPLRTLASNAVPKFAFAVKASRRAKPNNTPIRSLMQNSWKILLDRQGEGGASSSRGIFSIRERMRFLAGNLGPASRDQVPPRAVDDNMQIVNFFN